jgi:hypothetical protein
MRTVAENCPMVMQSPLLGHGLAQLIWSGVLYAIGA